MEARPKTKPSIELAPLIHQAALNPYGGTEELNQICDAAKYFNFTGLCTYLTKLSEARERRNLLIHEGNEINDIYIYQVKKISSDFNLSKTNALKELKN